MKGIKFILGTLAVAGLLGFSFTASAQENGNRDENGNIVRGSYETNGFWDNWFIGLGAGANTVAGENVDFKPFGGLAIDVNLGKWFTPTVGARIGYKGLKNAFDLKDNNALKAGYKDEFNQHLFHADFLWNLSNSFSGYKETRFWDIIPYAQFVGLANFKNLADSDKNNFEYAAGAGILNDFRLGNHVDLYLDLAADLARREALGIPGEKRYTFLPSLTAGLIFNLGRTNFDRHSSITPVVVPLPFTTDQYNALKDRVAQLEKENAALKDEINALKNAKPDTVYVGKESEVEPVSRTFFDLNSSKISAREKAHLDYFASQVIANTDKNYTIKGYADSATGSAAANDRISQARADAVKDYLVKNCGVDASRLNAVGQGGTDQFSKPISNNRTVVIE
ncbi:MAG: OmpA family protein [Bacteroidales bacterium]|nr:OmpA family protein [Bacteroidales bacterium]